MRNRTNAPTRQTASDPDLEVDEVEETEEEAKGIRPKDLAEELDISPKSLRAWLRKEYPRDPSEKNTNWLLTDEVADAATKHFTASEEETEEEQDDEEAGA